MSLSFSNSLPNDDSNLLVVTAFYNKSISGETLLLVKNSYLPAFCHNKAEIFVVCVYKSY